MLSSTGNDVESGANGLRVSRGDSLSENGNAGQVVIPGDGAMEAGATGSELPSSVRSSSTVQRLDSSQDQDDPLALSPSAIHGSTPLSQIGSHSCVNDMYLGQGIILIYFHQWVSEKKVFRILQKSSKRILF